MALQIVVNNPYNGISNEAYIKLNKINLDYYHKTGEIKLYIWHNAESRNHGAMAVGEININVGSADIYSNSTNALLQVKYENVYEKTIANIYNIIKQNKVEFGSQVLDLSTALNV